MVGNSARDNRRVVERWTLVDPATISDEATIEDPTVCIRPWMIGSRLIRGLRGEGDRSWEAACYEGERSADAPRS